MGRKSRAKWERRKAELLEPRLRWYHPALFGAAFLFAVVSLRVVFAVPYLIRDPPKLPEFILAPTVAAGAGAVGGLSYSFIGALLRRIPGFGRYLAGIVTVGGYLGAAMAAASFMPTPVVEAWDAVAIVSFVLVTLGFGIYCGHIWFEDDAEQTEPV